MLCSNTAWADAGGGAALYAHVQYATYVGGRRGVGVESSCGVKQGCPLSPTLFGLLLDGQHWALSGRRPKRGASAPLWPPGAGPGLCGRLLPAGHLAGPPAEPPRHSTRLPDLRGHEAQVSTRPRCWSLARRRAMDWHGRRGGARREQQRLTRSGAAAEGNVMQTHSPKGQAYSRLNGALLAG